MKFFSVLLVASGLVACATIDAVPRTDARGNPGYKLVCSEFNTSLQECEAKARALCGGPFNIDPQLSYRETYPDSGDGFYMPARQHLVVSCLP